ncbi:MAG: tetratricopeptide repeat protein, partial [Chloroflexaceae bacterium]|nr:tetratricopeptide repeat protein [Chloroflexaceae bacterium]
CHGRLRRRPPAVRTRPRNPRAGAGPRPPHTAQSLNNLAINLYYQQEYAAALPLMERAVAIWMQKLGAQHPNTQQAVQSLAAMRRDAEGGG